MIYEREGWRYDSLSGDLWTPCRGRLVRTKTSNGYYHAKFHGKRRRAHRIAWWVVHGVWPNIIDHKNRNRLDNRLENIQDGTTRTNGWNRTHQSPHGVGVVFYPHLKSTPFRAKAFVGGKDRHIGYFATAAEAEKGYFDWLKAHLLPRDLAPIAGHPMPAPSTMTGTHTASLAA